MKMNKTALYTVLMVAVMGSGLARGEEQAPTDKHHRPGPIHLNCDAHFPLSLALFVAQPGDTIRVSGTCNERITIKIDGLTIDGGGTAVLDGGGVQPGDFEGKTTDSILGVITVAEGVRGLTLRGLTIQNGAFGVVGRTGAAISLENCIVQDNEVIGVTGPTLTVDMTDCTLQRNGAGIDLITQSTLVLKGTNHVNENGAGIVLTGGSVFEVRGGTTDVSDNAGLGIVVAGSKAFILGVPDAQVPGTSLIADRNGGPGIILTDGALFDIGGAGFVGSQANTISASGNAAPGIVVENRSSINVPFANARFVLEDNPVGMIVSGGSGLTITGGLAVHNNGVGLLADAAGILHLGTHPDNPSSIVGNGLDVNLMFGTRVSFDGVEVCTIVDDGTTLSRGPTVCPAPAPAVAGAIAAPSGKNAIPSVADLLQWSSLRPRHSSR